jgi:hypothetical protein
MVDELSNLTWERAQTLNYALSNSTWMNSSSNPMWIKLSISTWGETQTLNYALSNSTWGELKTLNIMYSQIQQRVNLSSSSIWV